MTQFIFLLRPSIRPLTEEQVEQRTKQWRSLIFSLARQGKLVNWQVFEQEGVKVSGAGKRIIEDHPVVENNESAGGVITITAENLEEAVELSKSCPVLDYGGSVEVRPLKPPPGPPKIFKFAQPLALLTTGLLAGVYYYGYFTVIPAFYEVPLPVHLAYRVALMNHNSFYVQSLTAAAILAPIWLALTAKLNRRVRMWSMLAAIAALLSILTTRFGNVPINRLIRVWEAGQAPANWRTILDQWIIYNNIRSVFALASFAFVLVASKFNK
jgi:uncharacterized membrane protein